jgi:acetyl-CoA acetyltransferase family protein
VAEIAVLAGVRTPFAAANGHSWGLSASELGQVAIRGLLDRADLPAAEVDQVIFGNVFPQLGGNPARTVAIQAGIPPDRIAHTVSRNCASGMEAVTEAAQRILLGEARTVIAGGMEVLSHLQWIVNAQGVKRYIALGQAKGWWRRLLALLRFRPRHLKPVHTLDLLLTDPLTGLRMAETGEVLAAEFAIARAEADAYALLSRQRAGTAHRAGVFREQIVSFHAASSGGVICCDPGPQAEPSAEALAQLPPITTAQGTVTAGNSAAPGDGAVVLLLMDAAAARAEGRKPLGFLRAHAYAGCEPRRMGLGPAYAAHKLFTKTQLSLRDMDLLEINESFATSVLANERAFSSSRFAEKEFGLGKALGEIDRAKLNVNGGALALGDPLGATGARLILTLLKELARRGLGRGLALTGVFGGQGAAVLVEREP